VTHKHAGLAAQITPIECPLCKQTARMPTLEMIIDHYRLPAQQAAVLTAVWRGRGMPVPSSRIMDLMYADDPNGGPSQSRAYAQMKTILWRLRQALRGSGISILNVGYGRGYRLTLGDE
jgi:hypothetical protein